MHIPLFASDFAQAMQDLKPSSERFKQIIAHSNPTPNGQYFHWDQLRHRPPPEDLTSEEWWLSTAFARKSMFITLPLFTLYNAPFQFSSPPFLQDLLHHVDRKAGAPLRASSISSEKADAYLFGSLIEEAITSSQLEGASTTRTIAENMIRDNRRPKDASERMIFNNYQTMNYLREIKNAPITPELLCELHRRLCENTFENAAEVGTFRTRNDVRVVDNRDNSVLHTPPDFADLPERMARLCDFANRVKTDQTEKNAPVIQPFIQPFIHPVIRAILLHFMIGYDHPFADGNGRLARALFYLMMAKEGYFLLEYASISHFLRKAPADYVKSYLHCEKDGANDVTYFIGHQLKTIARALNALHEYVEKKQKDAQEAQILFNKGALRGQFNPRQIALLAHAQQNPQNAYRIEIHRYFHQLSYQTARTDLLNLVEQGLLEKTQQGNAFVFFPAADLPARLAHFGEYS